MKKWDLVEAVNVGTAILAQLKGVVNGSSVNADQLVYDCGVLAENFGTQLLSGAIWVLPAGLPGVFEQARLCGATYAQMDLIRTNVTALMPKGAPALALQNFVINLCLIEQTQILAATTFTARADIDAAFDAINAAFDAAIETASNSFDAAVYQALISLNAACAQDLSNRAQTLPRIVWYEFPFAMPSLWLAQRIYYDGSRADELAAENQAQHPLFMRSPVRALSA